MIRKLKACLVSAVIAAAQVNSALAWFVGGGELQGFHVGAEAPPATVTFIGCPSAQFDGSPHTFTSVNVGTASSDRVTAVSVHAGDYDSVYTVSSMTIGGDTATKLVDEGGLSGWANTAIFAMANPSGTSENIVVTHSESIRSIVICVWQINNLSSLTPIDTAKASSSSAPSLTLDVDTQAGGIVLAAAHSDSSGQSTTWSGVTENVDSSHIRASYSAASVATSTSSAPLAVSTDYSGSANTSAVSVSLR